MQYCRIVIFRVTLIFVGLKIQDRGSITWCLQPMAVQFCSFPESWTEKCCIYTCI